MLHMNRHIWFDAEAHKTRLMSIWFDDNSNHCHDQYTYFLRDIKGKTMLTLERPGGSNGPPIGFSFVKLEAFKQSK